MSEQDPSADWRREAFDQNHHLGTARTGDSPRDDVGDADLRVHGLDNPHLAGGPPLSGSCRAAGDDELLGRGRRPHHDKDSSAEPAGGLR